MVKRDREWVRGGLPKSGMRDLGPLPGLVHSMTYLRYCLSNQPQTILDLKFERC